MKNKLRKKINLDKKKLVIIFSSVFVVVMLIVLISTKGLSILKGDSVEKYDPSDSCIGCTTNSVLLGDFNLDGKVNWDDYYALAAYNTTLYKEGKYSTNSEDQLRAADWNEDGFVYFDDQIKLRNYLENQNKYDGYPKKTCGKDYFGPYKNKDDSDSNSYYCEKRTTNPYLLRRKDNKTSYVLEISNKIYENKRMGFNDNYKLKINNESQNEFESYSYSIVRINDIIGSDKFLCYEDKSKNSIGYLNEELCKKNGYVTFKEGDVLSRLLVTYNVKIINNYKKNKYKITYTNIASTNTDLSEHYVVGNNITIPNIKYNLSGKSFKGWYLQSNKRFYCYISKDHSAKNWVTSCDDSDMVLFKAGDKVNFAVNANSLAYIVSPGDELFMIPKFVDNKATGEGDINAQKLINYFTIKYYSNGGSGNMSDQKITYGVSTSLSANRFTKSGYKFIGWYAQRDDGTWLCYTDPSNRNISWTDQNKCDDFAYVVYDDMEKVAKTAGRGRTVKMYAQWKPNFFTVKYYSGGGSGKMSDQKITYGVSTSLSANRFTKSGYIFTGWNAQRDDGTWLCYTDPSNRNTAWTSINTCKNFAFAVYDDMEKVAKTAGPGRSVNMVAQWKSNFFTVKYYSNGGSGNMSDQKITYGVSTSLSANRFTKSGYKFIGWNAQRDDGTWLCYTDPSNRNTAWTDQNKCDDFAYVVYDDMEKVAKTAGRGRTVKMYAQWKPNFFTVKYYSGGGSGKMSDQKITYGVSTSLSANRFTKSGYKFIGWHAQRDDGTWLCYTDPSNRNTAWTSINTCKNFAFAVYDDMEKVARTAGPGRSVNMVAQWKSNFFTVKYYSNGGSGNMSDQKITYGVSTSLSANRFTKSGYKFIGWNAQRDDGTWLCYTDPSNRNTAWTDQNKCDDFAYVVYDDMEKVAKTAGRGRTVKMYAQWKPNFFTVKYYSGGGSGKMSDQKITYGVSTSLSANRFTKSGYKFIGWHAQRDNGDWLCYTDPSNRNTAWTSINTCKNFAFAVYDDMEKVARTAGPGRSVNMVAQWKKK